MERSNSITRRFFLFLTGGFLTKLGFGSALGPETNKKEMPVTEIMRRMAETYKNCKSYQDSGTVTTVFHHKDGKQNISLRPFTTAFVRPDRLRFEFKSSFDGHKWYRYIVWARGKDVRTWWDIHSESEQLTVTDSLALGLGGATGVSGGSAHTIPALLLPDQIPGSRLTKLVELKRLDDADLMGIACYRVQGKKRDFKITAAERDRLQQKIQKISGRIPEEAQHGPKVIWIDKSTYLVHRIDEKVQFESFSTEQTTAYNPLLDTPIAENHLGFRQPEK